MLTTTGVKKVANKGARKKKGEEAGPSESTVEITPAAVNWAKSTVTEAVLQTYEDFGELPKKEEIEWRAAGDEIRPKPCEGEVVVLLDHVTRGLRPPGSSFFRRVLAYYGLTPLEIGRAHV